MDENTLVRVLKALADANRFRMAQAISSSDGELSCTEVGRRFRLSQPTISHHLKILVEAGILIPRREAQHTFFSVNRALLDRVLEVLPGELGRAPKRRPRKSRKK